MDNREKNNITPEETGGILYYFVGSKTDDFLNNRENLKKIGLEEVGRDDLYIETAILDMFLMIKQYTCWEKDEAVYNKALDQMHFMLFHQLKEYSNYDQDDIEQLHQHIFRRYAEYGEAIEDHSDSNWLQAIGRIFLENINDEIEDWDGAIQLLAKEADNFYRAIPSMLNNL